MMISARGRKILLKYIVMLKSFYHIRCHSQEAAVW